MTHARHDERRAAEAAARERDEALTVAQRVMQENESLRKRFDQGAQAYAATALSGAEAKVAKAKKDLADAVEAYDSTKIADAQEALANAVAEMREAKNFRPTPLQRPNAEVQPRQPQAQPQVHAKTLEWQAKNPWYGAPGFEEYTSYALGLHTRLVTQMGLDPRSDEYFAQINARLGKVFPELFEDDNSQAQGSAPAKPKPPVVTAPATRSAPVAGKVKLSKSQVAIATKLGLTPKQYALQVVKLQQESA